MADLPSVRQAGRHLCHEGRRKRNPPAHRRPRAGSLAAVVPRWEAYRFLFEPERDLPDLDRQPRRQRSPTTHVRSSRALSGLVAGWHPPRLYRAHRLNIHGSGETLEPTDAENPPSVPRIRGAFRALVVVSGWEQAGWHLAEGWRRLCGHRHLLSGLPE